MQNSPRTIQIGLTAADAAWNLILRQIGIASKVISPTDDLLTDYSVIIATNDAEQTIQQNLTHYVEQGGILLVTPKAMHGIAHVPTVTKKVTSLPSAKNEHYEYHGILDLHSSLTYFANGDFVHSVPAGKGFKYYLGLDLAELLTTAIKRKNFYTPAGRMPNEVVATVSKGMLRQLIFSLLKGMHHRQSLPFIHLWYYPGSERTIFTFRIDSDKGTKEQVEEIRALGERHAVPTTWFLDVKSHESWLPSFCSFGDQEIALHCYEHILYRTASLNRENFQKALTLMKNAGLAPKGITAPTGGWNAAYAESISGLGFTYSSEFSYDYDDLPSFPVLNGAEFPIPQLPIHPVCVGTMLRARMNDDEMVRYFRSYIDAQLALNEPICLYQHPTHGHNGVFEEVFQYIDSLSIAKLSYSDHAEWWKHRNDSITAVKVLNGMIEAVSETGNVHHRVIFPDGRECLTALSEPVKSAALKAEQKDHTTGIPSDIMRSRKFDLRHLLQDSLDWWIKTTE